MQFDAIVQRLLLPAVTWSSVSTPRGLPGAAASAPVACGSQGRQQKRRRRQLKQRTGRAGKRSKGGPRAHEIRPPGKQSKTALHDRALAPLLRKAAQPDRQAVRHRAHAALLAPGCPSSSFPSSASRPLHPQRRHCIEQRHQNVSASEMLVREQEMGIATAYRRIAIRFPRCAARSQQHESDVVTQCLRPRLAASSSERRRRSRDRGCVDRRRKMGSSRVLSIHAVKKGISDMEKEHREIAHRIGRSTRFTPWSNCM